MIKNILTLLISFLFLIIAFPAYSIDSSPISIEKYTLRISKKFANTYCNSTKFGISNEGALKFSIGETNKEFSHNKLNKFIDYKILNKNILISLENNCQMFDFPEYELEKLTFKD